MTVSKTMKIHGEENLRKHLKNKLYVQGPVRNFLNRWGITVVNIARPLAPSNKGQIRSQLTHEVDSNKFPKWSRAGTNVDHAIFMEGGTGILSDLPGGKGGRHWPPANALEEWARLHGVPGGGAAVARAIGRRGGLRPRRFLRTGFEQAEGQVSRMIETCAREIEAEARKQAT